MRPFSLAGTRHVHEIASTDAILCLLTIYPDPEGHPDEVLRLALSPDDVVYPKTGGETYIAFSFDVEPIFEKNTGELQQLRLSVCNVNRLMQGYAEQYGGAVGANIEFRVVSTLDMDGDPLEFYQFSGIGAQSNAYTVDITIGADSPLRKKFPRFNYRRDYCMWRYKGVQCGYAGAMDSCDHSLSGANGCVAHNNATRFGAFPDIDSTGIYTVSSV